MNDATINPITLMIADDHQLFADGLHSILSEQGDFKVIGKAANGKEILHLLNHSLSDILIIDLNMPVLDGEIASEKISRLFPSVKIIVLSMYYTTNLAIRLKEMGVKAFIKKDTDAQSLFKIIKDVAQGNTYFQKLKPEIQEVNSFDDDDNFQKKHNLTYRELEILQLISETYSSSQIADKLCISIYTVDTHRKNMIQKLNVNGKTGLIKFAIENKR
ncbi:response regulator transcription factor [Pedobacter polaris]|uniref:Response regulator transcription factor n=1 Tax=Pedobacter polaris TaxID=2571273 RepID=A0A4U1CUV7_9SPHI|nr:response regulator transcription factor [Pedobacter polaris]TKC12674.1 response regulator transcription factor [Pedobacter polaris]